MPEKIQTSFERYEKKYFLTPVQQEYLLSQMKPYIEADEYGQYTICSIYYDTDDWQLVRESIEKPAYKEKLRIRSYGVPSEDDKIFVELKKKCSGIVYKRRITAETDPAKAFLNGQIPPARFGQIGREIAWFCNTHKITPKVFIAYDRTAYAGTADSELRITFDSNIRWRDTDLDLRAGDHGQQLLPDDRVLMEIKMPGACPLWLSRLLSEAGVFPTSFSKYGTCYCENILKNKTTQIPKEAFPCA